MNRSESLLHTELRQRAFQSPEQEAAVAILRTADVVRRRLAAAVEPHGVTLQQYNVLRILRGASPGPLPTLEIGERLIERTPGMTRLLDRLEGKSLVRRERSPEDRRLVHVWITDAGLELLANMDEEVDRADEEAVGGLGSAELNELLALLERIRRTER